MLSHSPISSNTSSCFSITSSDSSRDSTCWNQQMPLLSFILPGTHPTPSPHQLCSSGKMLEVSKMFGTAFIATASFRAFQVLFIYLFIVTLVPRTLENYTTDIVKCSRNIYN